MPRVATFREMCCGVWPGSISSYAHCRGSTKHFVIKSGFIQCSLLLFMYIIVAAVLFMGYLTIFLALLPGDVKGFIRKWRIFCPLPMYPYTYFLHE